MKKLFIIVVLVLVSFIVEAKVKYCIIRISPRVNSEFFVNYGSEYMLLKANDNKTTFNNPVNALNYMAEWNWVVDKIYEEKDGGTGLVYRLYLLKQTTDK